MCKLCTWPYMSSLAVYVPACRSAQRSTMGTWAVVSLLMWLLDSGCLLAGCMPAQSFSAGSLNGLTGGCAGVLRPCWAWSRCWRHCTARSTLAHSCPPSAARQARLAHRGRRRILASGRQAPCNKLPGRCALGASRSALSRSAEAGQRPQGLGQHQKRPDRGLGTPRRQGLGHQSKPSRPAGVERNPWALRQHQRWLHGRMPPNQGMRLLTQPTSAAAGQPACSSSCMELVQPCSAQLPQLQARSAGSTGCERAWAWLQR